MTDSLTDKLKNSVHILKDFTDILHARGIRHWIDLGTLLGAYRTGTLIPWDYDMDIFLSGVSGPQVESLLNELVSMGKIERGNFEAGTIYQFVYSQDLLRIDLYLCSEEGNTVKHLFCPGYSMPRFFVDELETIQLEGIDFPAPRHLPQLLALRYGESYMIPQWHCPSLNTDWEHVEHNLGTAKPVYSAYAPGIFDIFHVGHLNLFKRIKEGFGRLVVGVHDDQQCELLKRRPIVPYEQRLEVIRGCGYVDEVVENADVVTTNELLDRVNADYLVAGREDAEHISAYYRVSDDRLHLIERTEGISSTIIRTVCATSNQTYKR